MKETVVQTITLEQVLDQPQTLSGLLEEVLEATTNPKSPYKYEFVVDRARWVSGCTSPEDRMLHPGHFSGRGTAALLNDKGCMCCLGFVAVQCGNKLTSRLLGKGMPANVVNEWNYDAGGRFEEVLIDSDCNSEGDHEDSMFATKAASINDNCALTQPQREASLIEHFHAHGYELQFTGAYA
jgi:hypothetical protein